jgi:hypothetical protein
MRMCVEQGLHHGPLTKIPLLHEQLQRRVFWECYMIDRYSSSTLTRPFAIAEKDIEVSLPANANDDEIAAVEGRFADLDDFCASHIAQGDNEMSVFFACVHLRKITSRIQSRVASWTSGVELSSTQGLFATGQLYADMNELMQDLERWRKSAPIFLRPRCLYERQEWFDLIYFRERLVLIRKAVDMVPKRQGVPPKDLLELCLDASTSSIFTFVGLFERKLITNTRSYFQTLFTAGLSIMFCQTTCTDIDLVSVEEQLKALDMCKNTLHAMSAELTDARWYSKLFDALHRKVIKKFSPSSTPARIISHTGTPGPSVNPDSRGPIDQQSLGESSGLHQNETPYQSTNFIHFQQHPTATTQSSTSFPHPDSMSMYHLHSASALNSHHNSMLGMQVHGDDILQWTFLNDDTVWDLEAGLGEYAYGDPMATANIFSGFDS